MAEWMDATVHTPFTKKTKKGKKLKRERRGNVKELLKKVFFSY